MSSTTYINIIAASTYLSNLPHLSRIHILLNLIRNCFDFSCFVECAALKIAFQHQMEAFWVIAALHQPSVYICFVCKFREFHLGFPLETFPSPIQITELFCLIMHISIFFVKSSDLSVDLISINGDLYKYKVPEWLWFAGIHFIKVVNVFKIFVEYEIYLVDLSKNDDTIRCVKGEDLNELNKLRHYSFILPDLLRICILLNLFFKLNMSFCIFYLIKWGGKNEE